MSNSTAKMAENLTNVNDSIGDIKKDVQKLDNKITAVEKAPAEDVRYYKRLVIGGIITTVIGTILGALITIILK